MICRGLQTCTDNENLRKLKHVPSNDFINNPIDLRRNRSSGLL